MFNTLCRVAFCAALLTTVAHASKKNVLPDSCGADEVEFKLTTDAGTPLSAPVADGKARLVFVESYDKPGMMKTGTFGGGTKITTRFGLDGAWVGAAGSNNYFVVDVTPGEHKVCASVKGEKKWIGMDSVTAEAGKTYYFEARYDVDISTTHSSNGFTSMSGKAITYTGDYKFLKEDEGKFRIKASEPIASEVKK